MKVIDLEYLISNKEECPKTIVYEGEIYGFRDDLNDYENQYADFEDGINKFKYLFENPLGKNFIDFFNDEIEVIEEDKKRNKIAELPRYSLKRIQKAKDKEEWYEERITLLEKRVDDYHNKINQIIDHINKE